MINTENLIKLVPKEVSYVTNKLEKTGFEAFLVGGSVRDLILGRKPKDWDVTTNATPEQIISLFEKTVYENKFGTVAVMVPHETEGEVTYETIEVTPYRLEAKYTDNRHPDEVTFSNKLEDDLKRRDFTINALALGQNGVLIDLFDGIKDMEGMSVRTVLEADKRLTEDALRMMRAVRFACQLNFSVSYEVMESIIKNSGLLTKISQERIRDEFEKIILSDSPAAGVAMLEKFGLLKYIIPELEEGIGCEQGGEHIYDVWEHLLHALQHAADKKWPLTVRLAALFHDIGKPKSRRKGAAGKKAYSFYGHEVIGARMTQVIMERLKFPKKETDLVVTLVRNHMFFSDPEKITLSAVRRIIQNVGKENIWTLMNVRECDRVGMKKKEAPYRLRKYFAMIEEALHDPISVAQLKIDGSYLMNELKIPPGPRMGSILHALLEEVLEDPKKNTAEELSEITKKLNSLTDKELKALGDKAKEKKEELELEEVEKLHKKHGV
jgi:tRNA nucleotidyltransferase (CCA-adding enzyme)